jgi:hypothetical protein
VLEVLDVKKITAELTLLGENESLLYAAKDWLLDESVQESDLAWMFGFCFESGAGAVVALAPDFIKRYPESLFPVKVFFADLLAQNGLFDQASHEARTYLRCIKDAGMLGDLSGHTVFSDGIARAFLLLTSVYTEVGARTYSRKALEHATSLNLPAMWKQAYVSEISRLNQDIYTDNLAATADDIWEKFFEAERAMDRVLALCLERNFMMLAKRVELIYEKLRFDSAFQMGVSEIFMVIHEDDNGRLLLF